MRVGVTGHRHLADPSSWAWVAAEVDRILGRLRSPLVGITSLAVGADQLFAEAVLRQDGRLEVVVPLAGYEQTFAAGRDRHGYERLLARAAEVVVLPRAGSDEEGYMAAGRSVVDRAVLLVASRGGQPARRLPDALETRPTDQVRGARALGPSTESVL